MRKMLVIAAALVVSVSVPASALVGAMLVEDPANITQTYNDVIQTTKVVANAQQLVTMAQQDLRGFTLTNLNGINGEVQQMKTGVNGIGGQVTSTSQELSGLFGANTIQLSADDDATLEAMADADAEGAVGQHSDAQAQAEDLHGILKQATIANIQTSNAAGGEYVKTANLANDTLTVLGIPDLADKR